MSRKRAARPWCRIPQFLSCRTTIFSSKQKLVSLLTLLFPRLQLRHFPVALNPTDWRHIDFVSCNGATVGCDYAGIVEAVGPNVNKPFKKGDRVMKCQRCKGTGVR